MVNPKFKRRFSIAHWDYASAGEDHGFSHFFAQSSDRFKEEISDIYFGRAYYYQVNGVTKRYGEVMGHEANDMQVKRLLDIQEKYGVMASMTVNQSDPAPEIVGVKAIRDDFVKFIKSFYDSGLRMCTISDVHLMASGVLQEACPDMHWKNTVNHIVRSAQEVVDYAALGYQTVLVDRSLNRNVEELAKIKKVAERLGVKVSLLVAEGCMPSCPFKVEHDNYQAAFQNGGAPINNREMANNYWTAFGDLSCNRWRKFEPLAKRDFTPREKMPRVGTGIVAATKETFDLFLDNTDVMKFSGRLTGYRTKNGVEDFRFQWRSIMMDEPFTQNPISPEDQVLTYDCFSDAYEANAAPFHMWVPDACSPRGLITHESRDAAAAQAMYEARRAETVWGSKKGLALDKTLRNCRNQCYDCHACERVFGFKDLDTLLSVKKADGWVGRADRVIPILAAVDGPPVEPTVA